MNFDLPIISGEASPEFADAKSCSEWLEALPLINVGPSHGRLLGQLEELNCFEMPPAERMKILELMREAVVFVQTEHAKKFSAKAVPLTHQEREIFNNVLALWDGFAYGWEHCVQALSANTEGMSTAAALVCQRAMWSIGQKLAEHFKAYQSTAEQEWRRLHRIYALAEGRGVADQAVSHPAYKDEEHTTCAESYAHALLMGLANPNQHTPREQLLLSRWTERWARKVTISQDPPVDAGIAPLTVDLESGAGASRTGKQGPGVRFVHVDELEKSIRKRVAMLRNGESTEALGLGSDVPAALAGQMLVMLHQQWCEDRAARQSTRRVMAHNAELCSGLAAMHYYLTGQAFTQPGEAKELSQRQRNEIATFGRVSAREEASYIAVQAAALEHWNICDESVSGFCLERPQDGGNARFTHNQLVAVRPSDAKTFIICTVHWLSVSQEGALRMGTRVVPGVPQGIAIRPTGLNALSEKYIPALSLPALPALHSPATLVIPGGWYRPKRVIELYTDKAQPVMLSSAVERGCNFDRCTFEPA
jgi:hypothetical protein